MAGKKACYQGQEPFPETFFISVVFSVSEDSVGNEKRCKSSLSSNAGLTNWQTAL